VGVQYEVHLPAGNPDTEGVERIVRSPSRTEPIREPEEVFLVDRVQDRNRCPLDQLVFQGGDRKRALPTVPLGDVHPPGWHGPIRSPMKPRVQVLKITLKVCLVVRPCQPIHTGRGVVLEFEKRLLEGTRFPGPVPGACFAVPPSPWSLPFAPPTPQPVARPCS